MLNYVLSDVADDVKNGKFSRAELYKLIQHGFCRTAAFKKSNRVMAPFSLKPKPGRTTDEIQFSFWLDEHGETVQGCCFAGGDVSA